ncbi:unnamed protein product [Protopolystoma xenopodis]|uniref:Uncharacterized protein n=1 Tax=Protopolystoma xenopodis TaxID=117903 RepID=A0A3S5FH95_9PLAT|nr:unnamed protein product [Protopolystoma xenopodis]
MDYITQFTSDARYVKVADNIVADILSRMDMVSVVPDTRIDWQAMAKAQELERNQRFSHLHIDIVGPLPPSKENRYLYMVIYCFTQLPEAIPIRDIQAETVTKAFVLH